MANTIKYGIVGAGHLGNYHAAQLNKISCVDFVGIYDVSLGRAKKLSVKHNSKAFNSINTLLSLKVFIDNNVITVCESNVFIPV